MLAAVLKDFDKLVLEDVPTPTPGPGEALVRVKACGFCATDYKAIKGIRRNVKFPLIAGHEPPESLELCSNWRDDVLPIQRTLANRGRQYNGYPVSAGYFGSYCMDGLAVALWAVRHTRSFDDCIERAINFLGDADSHGSIAGQIAGAVYGYCALHARFKRHLQRWDDHEVALRGVLLYHASG